MYLEKYIYKSEIEVENNFTLEKIILWVAFVISIISLMICGWVFLKTHNVMLLVNCFLTILILIGYYYILIKDKINQGWTVIAISMTGNLMTSIINMPTNPLAYFGVFGILTVWICIRSLKFQKEIRLLNDRVFYLSKRANPKE